MLTITKLKNRETKLAVIGLGYVGLPLASAFSEFIDVIGFDLNEKKIDAYKRGLDLTRELQTDELYNSAICFTSEHADLTDVSVFIIAVPTPINHDKTPDLAYVSNASKIVGQYLKQGSVVIYESTVYPGTTEEVCIPLLEEVSGLLVNKNFYVGYSPERINPSDKVHTLRTIRKIISGSSEDAKNFVADLYSMIVEAGVHPVSSIKVAEAAKVVENSQRDINIAFMNELAMIFQTMNIDTYEVIEAMNTKWNALKFVPGLVGGHCIGIDPYYFIYKAELLGYHSQIMLAGRQINDDMPKFIVSSIVKSLICTKHQIHGLRVGILGITYKENCSDIRNSKVIDIIEEMRSYKMELFAVDYLADKEDVFSEYAIPLCDFSELHDLDVIILAVAHDHYKAMSWDKLSRTMNHTSKFFVDIRGIRSRNEAEEHGFYYWSL